MKTAGVVLDFYDDVSKSHMKRLFPDVESLPESIKTAHILSPEEHDVLRDEAYALILHSEGKTLRKFACVDEGNTVLSVLYFLNNKDRLPEEAVKTASVNLEAFCEEFGIEVPEVISKVASAAKGRVAKNSGMSRERDSSKQPLVGDEQDWAQRTNLVSIQGGSDSGRVISTANQMKTAAAKNAKGKEGYWEKKDGSFGIGKKKYDDKKDQWVNLDSFHKLNPEANPHRVKLSSPVDVDGVDAPVLVKRSSAEVTALGGRYPLDSMADVQKAIEYFNDNRFEMEPVEAHIFAVKTASRADEIGLKVPEELARYGSKTYADDVDAHMASRISNTEPEFVELYEELREKRASIPPEEFAELLGRVDEMSGLRWSWGGNVADPYYSTFGKTASSWSWQSRTGDFVSEDDLIWLARNARPLIHKHFSSDLVNGFIAEPIPVFDSLPDDSKAIIARLASGRFDGMNTN